MQVARRAGPEPHVAHMALQPAQQQEQLVRRHAVGAAAVLQPYEHLGAVVSGGGARRRPLDEQVRELHTRARLD